MKGEKLTISMKIDKKTIELIDEFAKNEQRSRTSFFIFSALQQIKRQKATLGEGLD